MTRQIVVHVDGNVDLLLSKWPMPSGLDFRRTSQSLEFVLAGAHQPEFQLLKQAAAALPAGSITIGSFFQAFDFTREDLEKASYLQLRVLNDAILEPGSDLPIRFERCDACFCNSFVYQEKKEIIFLSESCPSDLLLGHDVYKLAHSRLLKDFEQARYTNGLATTPCQIVYPGGESNNYSWLRGTYDLGPPSGRVVYDAPCAKCGQRTLKENENFGLTFSSQRPSDIDFATSSFYDPGFLAVSQRVYRRLNQRSDAPSTMIFEPVDFAD